MREYDQAIDKAIVELAMAKLMGTRHGSPALQQAVAHLAIAKSFIDPQQSPTAHPSAQTERPK